MAEKIYPASPYKRKKEREKGNVVKSTDIITLATLIASLSFIYTKKDSIYKLIEKFMYLIEINFNKEFDINILSPFIIQVLLFVLPLIITIGIVGFLANFFQVGFKFTPKAIVPKLEKINPIKGFKRVFSKDALIELAKSLLKVVGVLYITIIEIKKIMLKVNDSYTTSAYLASDYIFDSIFNIVIKISMLLLTVSLVDYTYKKFKYEKDIKMTRQEMMDEFKNTEGNPQIKNKQKEFGRMLSRKQIQKVKEATVLVTNPTHFAIAIKYDEGSVPMILFKGVDEIAQAAKTLALENDIPMVENKPLARELFAKTKEGEYIQEEFYDSVASVIRYVYMLNEDKK